MPVHGAAVTTRRRTRTRFRSTASQWPPGVVWGCSPCSRHGAQSPGEAVSFRPPSRRKPRQAPRPCRAEEDALAWGRPAALPSTPLAFLRPARTPCSAAAGEAAAHEARGKAPSCSGQRTGEIVSHPDRRPHRPTAQTARRQRPPRRGFGVPMPAAPPAHSASPERRPCDALPRSWAGWQRGLWVGLPRALSGGSDEGGRPRLRGIHVCAHRQAWTRGHATAWTGWLLPPALRPGHLWSPREKNTASTYPLTPRTPCGGSPGNSTRKLQHDEEPRCRTRPAPA